MSGNKVNPALKKIDDYLHHCTSDLWKVPAMMAKMECYWLAWKQGNVNKHGNFWEKISF